MREAYGTPYIVTQTGGVQFWPGSAAADGVLTSAASSPSPATENRQCFEGESWRSFLVPGHLRPARKLTFSEVALCLFWEHSPSMRSDPGAGKEQVHRADWPKSGGPIKVLPGPKGPGMRKNHSPPVQNA